MIFASLLSLTLLAAVAFAQPEQKHSGPDREQIRAVIIGKFASEMDLTPDQAEKFFPRLRQFQDGLEAVQREDRDTRRQLEQLSQTPNADHGQLNKLLDQRRSAERRVAEMRQQFLTDISGFLTPQQVSKCSILMDDLPHKVREMIREKERARGKDTQVYPDGPNKDQQGRKGY